MAKYFQIGVIDPAAACRERDRGDRVLQTGSSYS